MNNVDIIQITTKDKILHEGIYVEPVNKTKKALLYIHGLTSAFYHNLTLQDELIQQCRKNGIGYASFNNRGHDAIAYAHKLDASQEKGIRYITIGAGNEHFEESILDIDSGISFLLERGYTSIYLIGHSTGANKVCFYAGQVKNKKVKGVILASPISDRLDPGDKNQCMKRIYLKVLIALGFGDKLFTNITFFPITPKRALSLIEPGSIEDVFDYGEKQPKLTTFCNITIPLLIVLADHDEHADRPIKNIQNTFDMYANSSQYSSCVIDGTMHGFEGKEKEFAKKVVDWIKKLH